MILFPILTSFASIVFALVVVYFVKKFPVGEGKQIEIWQAIKEGSEAYLKRKNKPVAAVALPIAAVIWYAFGWHTAFGFLIGALASSLAGYFGMKTAVDANVRTTEAAKNGGLQRAFRVAFLGGSVTGFLVVGFGLLSVSLFYFIFEDLMALVGLGFGGSLISIFARLGGGIFTKGADVGADLVGKGEAGIPEEDPRNPAVIADQVGDMVGDVAGMAADLFETYAVTAIASMLLGSFLFPGKEIFILLPLIIGGVAIVASMLGFFVVKVKEGGSIMGGLYRGLIAAALLAVVFLMPALSIFMEKEFVKPYFISALAGILVTIFMVLATEYYTSKKFRQIG